MGYINPKQKAEELVKKMDEEFSWAVDYGRTDAIAKNLATIAVNLLIEHTPSVNGRPPN